LQFYVKTNHDQGPRSQTITWRDRCKATAVKAVSKTPNDIVDQFKNLQILYQELLALRSRVRQAERVARGGEKSRRRNAAGGKVGNKRSK
jgi:hypothetical protein